MTADNNEARRQNDNVEQQQQQAEPNSNRALDEVRLPSLSTFREAMDKMHQDANPADSTHQSGDLYRTGSVDEAARRAHEHISKELPEPNPREVQAAANALDRITDRNPFMTEQDRQTFRDLHRAVVSGDSEGFAKAIERFKNDPEGLRRFMDQLNKNLQETGSGVRVSVNKQGDKVTIMGIGQSAVEIGTDGRASVRQVTQLPNGLVLWGRQDHETPPASAMRTIAHGARSGIIWTSQIESVTGPKYRPTEMNIPGSR